MLGLPVGLALANMVGGAVAHAWGWRATYLLAGIPGILVAAATLALIAEPARGAAETAAVGAQRREGSPYLLLLRIPTMWWIILSGALHNFNMYALATFLPAFLIRTHGLDIREAGLVAGVAIGVAGGIGLYAGGHLADSLHQTRPNGRMLLGSLCMFGAVPFQVLAISQPPGSAGWFLALFLPASMMMYVYYSTVYASIHDIVEPALRGTAMAVYFFAMYLMGASFGPIGTGLLSDLLARQAAGGGEVTEAVKAVGLHQAMYVIPALGVMLGAVLWAGSRTFPGDREKLHVWMRELSH
jgi:MFS family permease